MAWGLEGLFPALKVEFGNALWLSPSAVRLDNLQISEKMSGREVLRIKALSLRFPWRSFLGRRIEEITLEEPVLLVSPEFFTALLGVSGENPSSRSQEKALPFWAQWTVGHLRCNYGELRAQEMTQTPAFVRAHFAFHWEEFSTAEASASREQQITAWDIRLGTDPELLSPLVHLDFVEIDFTTAELWQQGRLGKMTLDGGRVKAGPELQALLEEKSRDLSPAENTEASKKQTSSWMLGNLQVEDLRVSLSGDIPGLGPGFDFTLHTTLWDLPLRGVRTELTHAVQSIELANIQLLSPIDPMVRVVTLHSLFVYFTLQGLLESRLDRIVVLNPTIYLSPDLFLYMQEMRPESSEPSAPGEGGNTNAAKEWTIGELKVNFGRLVIGGERQGEVGLPMSFQTTAHNVSLADLASLRLETQLQIDPQSFSFPELQIALENVRGELRFSYPPQEAPDNLVNQLFVDAVEWRKFQTQDVWLAATFDKSGIYGRLGGMAYGGYVTAGLSFSFAESSRWLGWVAGTGVDLQKMTHALTPENLQLSGKANFTVEIDAVASHISRVKGELHIPQPGLLRVPRLDALAASLPEKWGILKRSGIESALAVVQNYRYDAGKIDFWFVEGQGKLQAYLQGPQGKRTVDIYLHGDESPYGRWKKGGNQNSGPMLPTGSR